MDQRVAKRYARALFNAAKQLDVVESVEDDLLAIANLMKNQEQFRDFLLTPRISRDEKLKIAEKLFSDRITALTMQAIRVLLEKRREMEFPEIREQFAILRRQEGNILYAVITTIEPLAEGEKDRLIEKLRGQTGKTVEAEYRIDQSLIGGIRVAYGNYVLDGSIRGSLTRLRNVLRRDLLKQG
jgi:F-type H+-transporting ATPase subunit delta